MTTTSDTPACFVYPWRWLTALTGLFAAANAFYYAQGITFVRGTLIEMLHFADPELLRTRLLETLWYLHIQPPLLNLFVGLVLKVTPESKAIFLTVFLLLGLTLYLCTFLLQLRLGVNRLLAAVLATLFMVSPPFMLWENFLMYTLPCAALLALAAVCLFDVLDRAAPWAVAVFFGALFLVCGMRSMFHLGYFVLVALAVAAACKGHRKRILAYAALPCLLLLSLYVKNYLIFGDFGACTFVGKNLWIMTTGNMRGEDRMRLIQEGKLSPLSLVNRWESLDCYPARFREVPERFRNIPVLSQARKSNGAINYNHYGNIEISRIYGEDAKYVLRHYPGVYAVSVLTSCWRYFKPSSELPVAVYNQAKIAGLLGTFHLACGKVDPDFWEAIAPTPLVHDPPCLVLLLGLPAVALLGVYRALKPGPLSSAQRGVLCFMLFTIAMVAALGCALDFTDGARYRFKTDAFYVALAGLMLQALADRFRKKRTD